MNDLTSASRIEAGCPKPKAHLPQGLRHFAGLRRLHLSLYELDDIAGFAQVADGLEELNFGGN
jgi:hypothetical protein